MGWRKLVHGVTGVDLHRHFSFVKDTRRIEFFTDPDGETLGGASFFRDGQLMATTGDPKVVQSWIS